MQVERFRDDMNIEWVRCTECSRVAQDLSNIDHESKCSLTHPDDVDGIDKPTLQTIRELVEISETTDGFAPTRAENLRDHPEVRWVRNGSTARNVVGIGRTDRRGEWRTDGRGVVVKLDPELRHGMTARGGNLDEIQTWERAQDTGDDDLFAEIWEYAHDGMWLAMEETVPIFPDHQTPEWDGDWLQGSEEISALRSETQRRRWSHLDHKHGNVGWTDVPVWIDFGTGFDYQA